MEYNKSNEHLFRSVASNWFYPSNDRAWNLDLLIEMVTDIVQKANENVASRFAPDTVSIIEEKFEEASCLSVNPDVFFDSSKQAVSFAKSVCKSCPLQESCLDKAMSVKGTQGIWGGYTEEERRALQNISINR